MYQPLPPDNTQQLLRRCRDLAGLSLEQLAERLRVPVPGQGHRDRGWGGRLIETALGADAGPRPVPDFRRLGIELKTIPVDRSGHPRESTYVCSLPLKLLRVPPWEACRLRRKLARVLWLPVLSDAGMNPGQRRIGTALLWSPNADEELLLRADWEEIMDRVCFGQTERLNAHQGNCLQVRPKAANGSALGLTTDPLGEVARTMPSGFYLRSHFTQLLLRRCREATPTER